MSNHCLPPVITSNPANGAAHPGPRLPLPPYFDQQALMSRVPQATTLVPVSQPVTLKPLMPEHQPQQLLIAEPPESVLQLVRTPPMQLHHLQQHHQPQHHQQQPQHQQPQHQQQLLQLPSVSVSPMATVPISKSSPVSSAPSHSPKIKSEGPAPKKRSGGKDGRGYKALPFQLEKKDGKIEYRCHHCEKVFGQLSNLKVHLRTHTVSLSDFL
jgi:hypothetical protein